MAYAAWSVVANEQPSAAKWNILGTNDAHFYGFLGDNEAWQDWSPSYSGITVGSGAVVSKYGKIGNTVHFSYQLILNTSSISDACTVSLPSAAATRYGTATTKNPIGLYVFTDVSTGDVYQGHVNIEASTTVMIFRIHILGVATTGNPTKSSTNNPVAEANGDVLSVCGTYESAT